MKKAMLAMAAQELAARCPHRVAQPLARAAAKAVMLVARVAAATMTEAPVADTRTLATIRATRMQAAITAAARRLVEAIQTLATTQATRMPAAITAAARRLVEAVPTLATTLETRTQVDILSLVLHHDEQAVLTAVELALTEGVPTKTHVLNLLHRLVYGKVIGVPPLGTPKALALHREPKANVERCDGLRAQIAGGRHAS